MIAELLNRDFVLEQLADVRSRLLAVVRTEDDAALVQELASAEQREHAYSSGQLFPLQPGRRRGQGPVPLDDFAFISRDPIVSTFQSALEAYFDEHPEHVVEGAPSDDHRRSVGDEILVTDRSLRLPPIRKPPPGRRVFNRFSITDVQWIRSKIAEGVRLLRKRHDFNMTPAAPVSVSDRVRLILVGDWATGLPRARKVAKVIKGELKKGNDAGLEQHVVHLGDIYYSGWEHEVRSRFLRHWPVDEVEADRIGSWALNGNHDMFSGGHGYFRTLLGDRRFARQSRSSFFSFVNQHWKILGIDTAWDDHGLKDPQVDWLAGEINEGGRKTLLLSHHQMFSSYETIPSDPPGLPAKIGPILTSEPVTAWFWGHEHRCLCLKETDSVQFPRCVGHGGVPVYMNHAESDAHPPAVAYEYRKFVSKSFGLEKWALQGFVVLDFDGDRITARYIDENANEHRTEPIG
jgi:hypothetical protein